MSAKRQLSVEDVRLEKEKIERANLITSLALSDKQLMADVRASLEEMKQGPAMSWEDFKRQEDARRKGDI